MPAERVPSQQEIDSAFRGVRDANGGDDPARRAPPYDFRRPDRIAKDQLRAIHLLHENFARSIASSLSAYLRAYVAANLVSVEQLSFAEFAQCLPSPTCLSVLGMKPYEGSAVLELSTSLVFPILEMLLGGSGKSSAPITREITEIELSILEGLFRILLHDLRQSWQSVTALDFTIQNHETEPQLLQILSPNEAVVAIAVEIRVGDNSGMMNLGIPSIVVKMLRQKFDQQWSMRKSQSTEDGQERILRLIKPATLRLEAMLSGPTLKASELLDLKPGDLLAFDYCVDQPVDLLINKCLKYRGDVVSTGRKRAFLIEKPYLPSE
ncbi:MAG TPA: flagellar motor switch protein FliM [Bryobacteraceae bacterium]|nr:flagellar motor switch protein FliM [Bryobacteraceae bacterium]